jgi:hypothetical protein
MGGGIAGSYWRQNLVTKSTVEYIYGRDATGRTPRELTPFFVIMFFLHDMCVLWACVDDDVYEILLLMYMKCLC